MPLSFPVPAFCFNTKMVVYVQLCPHISNVLVVYKMAATQIVRSLISVVFIVSLLVLFDAQFSQLRIKISTLNSAI